MTDQEQVALLSNSPELGLSIKQALAVRDRFDDASIILQLLKVKPGIYLNENLKKCFEFLQTRGDKLGDHQIIVKLL